MKKTKWNCLFCDKEYIINSDSYINYDYHNESCPFCNKNQRPAEAIKGIDFSNCPTMDEIKILFDACK